MIIDKTNVNISYGNDKIWDALAEGDTDFSFQLGSIGMKNIVKKIKPKSIFDLAEINAVYRPGPLKSGLAEKYTDIKNGKKVDLSEEEQIIYDILKKEFGKNHIGLLIFQEDVMKLCQIGAGFTLSEADDIRKAMGKKKFEALIPYKEKFLKNWKYKKFVEIDGLGIFDCDHVFELEDHSGTITAEELLEKVQAGEEIDIIL